MGLGVCSDEATSDRRVVAEMGVGRRVVAGRWTTRFHSRAPSPTRGVCPGCFVRLPAAYTPRAYRQNDTLPRPAGRRRRPRHILLLARARAGGHFLNTNVLFLYFQNTTSRNDDGTGSDSQQRWRLV